jgi:hypothetical protein
MIRRKQPGIPDQLPAGNEGESAYARDRLLDALKKALAERALYGAMDDHLDQASRGC